jgi:hypothetical protein
VPDREGDKKPSWAPYDRDGCLANVGDIDSDKAYSKGLGGSRWGVNGVNCSESYPYLLALIG